MRLIALTPLLLAAGAAALAKPAWSPVTALEDSYKVPGDNPLYYCDNPETEKYILEVESVDIDPNPPKAGKTLTIKAKGKFTEDVEEGAKVHLTVKYGLITIIRQTADLCDAVKNVELECPLEEGVMELSKDVDLPSQIPNGKYTVLADVVTKDDDKITCLKATVEFKKDTEAAQSKKSFGLWKEDM
ncbi:hypothetical protein AMS68_005496 [Peltaster fructicola]|uniref:Phosphatidylglycerol/phosphatidylinositol transfer protein n=1 Tax=Peltaster fructicola TaxID=286661 RepID=A0A6H0XZD7_9PEZI|nr:hypothetical protein AMS68_005496 [Peltaster fructicola]